MSQGMKNGVGHYHHSVINQSSCELLRSSRVGKLPVGVEVVKIGSLQTVMISAIYGT